MTTLESSAPEAQSQKKLKGKKAVTKQKEVMHGQGFSSDFYREIQAQYFGQGFPVPGFYGLGFDDLGTVEQFCGDDDIVEKLQLAGQVLLKLVAVCQYSE